MEELCYRRARRYVAGIALDDAIDTVQRLHQRGLAVSLDVFGEDETDPDAIEEVVGTYEKIPAALAATRADVYLEIVPSHLGIDVGLGYYRRQVERVVEVLPEGTRLEISAEESRRTESILQGTLALARDKVPLVQTLQANLFRSDRDAERLVEASVPIRLVKGAYVEPAAVARTWGEETDVAYLRLANAIHSGGVGLALGTHDPVLREALLAALPRASVEMLLGVREDDAADLVDRGHHVRIYVPFGDDWFRYWMRRVAESAGA